MGLETKLESNVVLAGWLLAGLRLASAAAIFC
jgi:hypothetical protein